MDNKPTPTGFNGRDESGRFAYGNACAKGNPLNRRVQRLRAELIRNVKADDIQAIVKTLIERAKAGDVAAAREVLDRCIGKGDAPLIQLAMIEEKKDKLEKIEIVFVDPAPA
jgi:hypothetical protein